MFFVGDGKGVLNPADESRSLGILRKSSADVRLDDRAVRGVNRTIGIHIRPEIRSCHRLPDSRFGLSEIGCVYVAIPVAIANQDSHCRLNVADIHSIVHVSERYDYDLSIDYAAEVNRDLVPNNGKTAHASNAAR